MTSHLIESLEALVRLGQFDKAEAIMRTLSPKRIQRPDVLRFANIATRVNRHTFALAILNPIVRADAHVGQSPPSPLEQIEYAEALRKLGAIGEARQILLDVDGSEFPQATLRLAFCAISVWRYDEAIPLLEKYVANASLTDYQRTVGNINLLAALSHEGLNERALKLALVLRTHTLEQGYNLLFSNSLEISAQLELVRENWAGVYAYLDQAAASLNQSGQPVGLWVRKWKAIAESQQKQEVTPALHQVCATATASAHWETVRDCQFHIARIEQDADRMARVYFGTPYDGYRASILKKTGNWFKPKESFVLHSAEQAPSQILDVKTARIVNGEAGSLAVGQIQHRLLTVLSRDFFKPLPLVAIFAQLFPDEQFNPTSSPTRVYQAIRRLRKWTRENNLDLNITEHDGAYRLNAEGRLALQVPLQLEAAGGRELQLESLLQFMNGRPFSIQEANRKIGGSISTTQRLLRWGVHQRALEVVGAGPRTQYKVAAAQTRRPKPPGLAIASGSAASG